MNSKSFLVLVVVNICIFISQIRGDTVVHSQDFENGLQEWSSTTKAPHGGWKIGTTASFATASFKLPSRSGKVIVANPDEVPENENSYEDFLYSPEFTFDFPTDSMLVLSFDLYYPGGLYGVPFILQIYENITNGEIGKYPITNNKNWVNYRFPIYDLNLRTVQFRFWSQGGNGQLLIGVALDNVKIEIIDGQFTLHKNIDFEDGLLPQELTRQTQSPNNGGWKVGHYATLSFANSMFPEPFTGNYIIGTNDEKCDCDSSNDLLSLAPFQVPVFVNSTDQLTYFQFDWYYTSEFNQMFYFMYSVDNGVTWRNDTHFHGFLDAGWGKWYFDLTPYFNKTISFRWKSSDSRTVAMSGSNVGIDNIRVWTFVKHRDTQGVFTTGKQGVPSDSTTAKDSQGPLTTSRDVHSTEAPMTTDKDTQSPMTTSKDTQAAMTTSKDTQAAMTTAKDTQGAPMTTSRDLDHQSTTQRVTTNKGITTAKNDYVTTGKDYDHTDNSVTTSKGGAADTQGRVVTTSDKSFTTSINHADTGEKVTTSKTGANGSGQVITTARDPGTVQMTTSLEDDNEMSGSSVLSISVGAILLLFAYLF